MTSNTDLVMIRNSKCIYEAGNEDTEERAVWSLFAVGGRKLLQVLTQGTDMFDVQLTPH